MAGLLLAAGGGRRLGGRPKALLPHRRPPAGGARGAGAARRRLRAACTWCWARRPTRYGSGRELPGCVLVDNPDWEEGMGSSLRAGLASLAGTGAPARRWSSLVDQPGVGRGGGGPGARRPRGRRRLAALVGRVRRAARPSRAVRRRPLGGRRGECDRRPGGTRRTCRSTRRQITLVECGDVAEPVDIDTPDDLRTWSDGLALSATLPRPGESDINKPLNFHHEETRIHCSEASGCPPRHRTAVPGSHWHPVPAR